MSPPVFLVIGAPLSLLVLLLLPVSPANLPVTLPLQPGLPLHSSFLHLLACVSLPLYISVSLCVSFSLSLSVDILCLGARFFRILVGAWEMWRELVCVCFRVY